jgi:hypothetical protein
VKEVFNKVVKHPAFPISLLVLICLVTGFLTFQDYGMGWDEPLFYKYADAIPYAYSITERLSGDFNILKAYGPSETDHMMYGPAYILFARPFVLLIMALTSSPNFSAWHLINFILFIIGVVFLYLLAKKWMPMWAAFSAALLFATQPLLWGHAFINPKDIPFTVIFIMAIYAGYGMVEKASLPEMNPNRDLSHPKLWKIVQIFLWIVFSLLLLTSISSALFKSQIQEWIPVVVRDAIENPATLPGIIFKLLANNSSGSNPDAYITKGLGIFNRFTLPLYFVTTIFGIMAMLSTFRKELVNKWYQTIKISLSWKFTIFAGVALGFLTAIRILGPLAGFIVSLFFVFRFKRRSIPGIVAYAAIAFLTMYFLWPYLWRSPISGLLAVLKHMANNPQNVPVLFGSQVLSSKALPLDYFLTMLGLTLTEPVWLIFIIGFVSSILLMIKGKLSWQEFVPIFLWFLIPFTYVILTTPPQYDGFRHFTFLLPPVFIVGGFSFFLLIEKNKVKWLNPILIFLIVLPGLLGIISLHPYQYTYYNSFIGGTKGAFRIYETDYWLTCYKEVFDELKRNAVQQKVFVHRNKYLATQYAGDDLMIEQFEPDLDTTQPGDLLLLSSRSNLDQKFHVSDPSLLEIKKDGAVFCIVKQIQ